MPFNAGEHPRLLFTASELPALRAQAARGAKAEMLAHLKARCAELMDPAHPDCLDWRERKRDIWRTRKGIFPVVSGLETLATGYAFTGDAAIGDYARDVAMTIIEENLADVPSKSWGAATQGWRRGPGHDKGKLSQAMAWVYDFCYDRFSAPQRARFADFVRTCMILNRDTWREDWWQIANNRGSRGILGASWLAMALDGEAELPDSPKAMADCVWALEHYLFLAHDVAGAPFEGPGYAGCLGFMAATAEALRRWGGPNLLTNRRFERMPEYMAYEMLPWGGAANNWNDCDEVNGAVAGSLPLMGTPRGRLIPWLARQLELHPSRGVAHMEGQTLLLFLLWWKEQEPVRTPADLGYPVARLFPGRGIASMRTGWGPQDWLLSHYCGPQQYKCHRQGDFNHISLYALGERFLIDAGYGGAARMTNIEGALSRWFGETEVHNCVMLDGGQQRGTAITRGWPEGEMIEFRHGPEFDATLGDASATCGPDHCVLRALRRVVFVRGGPAPYIAVVDVNEKDGAPFRAEAHWHTDPANRVELEGRRFVIHGRESRCDAEALYPPDAQVSLADSYTRPQVRVISDGKVVETVTVFCPRRAGEKSPSFTAEREGEGRFKITCELDGKRSTLRCGAVVEGVERRAAQTELRA
jgi:hypothetical protein